MTTTREVQLKSRPVGWPTHDDFELVESAPVDLADGQVRVRNEVMSVDPYMRGRMSDAKSYAEPYALGEAMHGGAVGVVTESRADGVAVGDHVLHGLGWREEAVVDASGVRVVDTSVAPASAYLGVLGMTGLTAYAGLTRVAGLKEGDVVFVSGAAGAVGSVVGQVARALGASRVIGSAGSDEKVRHLIDDLGFDAAFNYKDGRVSDLLREAAPDGIDVYFDNVGGDHLEAAIGSLRLGGRIAVCGAISVYNNTEPAPGPRNLARLIQTRGTITGFLVGDHWDLAGEYAQRASGWIADGTLTSRETFADGIDHAVDAFLGVLRGENVGKMVVRL
ncbi:MULTISPECIES: NADP-dependent oxidoreductase [unclassified Terrabacter]|jgi:NADPH-dependent curcumin reductase CurA|uniref:NADP-dependent oxidoreductase n=1 Tax=unclassified Terrabacter TaxID=2630222 RepID=UPI0006F63DD6|nr:MULTISPECIES: NADP-dependent oxidoreductase [unclassified Terrabacter]KRB44018.1 NADP-dependent oxidoreductase [Terrabacter sp. Root181]KRF39553.1 NADP-dependent oxidoreductase [Terrabacter sp. Soil810]